VRKLMLTVAGVLVVALGVVWTLQGLDVIKGSGMSGTRFWAIIGPVVAVVGVAMVVGGLRGYVSARSLRRSTRR
jgi:hypothetical protein